MGDLLDRVNTLQDWVLLGLTLLAFGLQVYALVDALRQKSAAFPAAGKLTKQLWLVILGVSAAVGFVSLSYPFALLFLNTIAVVAACVYLVDVKPAVRRFRDRGGSSGPYGAW